MGITGHVSLAEDLYPQDYHLSGSLSCGSPGIFLSQKTFIHKITSFRIFITGITKHVSLTEDLYPQDYHLSGSLS
jgi:hypothetical protein